MRPLLPKNQDYYNEIMKENAMLKKTLEEINTRHVLRKNYSQYSERHKNRIRSRLQGVINNANQEFFQGGSYIFCKKKISKAFYFLFLSN